MRVVARILVSVAVCLAAGGALSALPLLQPVGAGGEQASEPASPASAQLDAGANFSCAIVTGGQVRCWGYGAQGELGYPGVTTVGAGDTPASVGPVDIGSGFTATAISSGDYHTCVIRNDGSVLCWGYGADGRLGYGNTSDVGETETPGSVGPVNLGPGHTAEAISAGGGHTCAILDDGSVRCWGYGYSGQLGYDGRSSLGDTPATTPDRLPPVNLGPGRTATAISAGGRHTCAILDDGTVRCWGNGGSGRLGYGDASNIGDGAPDLSVAVAGPVDLGPQRTAVAISAGNAHTCAILDDGTLRCWGFGFSGELGYGSQSNVGNTPADTPDKAGPVDLGPGRTATAISAGSFHTCAILDDGSVRCWGYGGDGRLGYGNTNSVGDQQTPGSVGPVDLGAGRSAVAISAGADHTCARLEDGSVRCWGYGGNGRLGYCNQSNVGDAPATTPDMTGPVNLVPGDGGELCPPPAPVNFSPPSIASPTVAGPTSTEGHRERGWRNCLAAVSARAKHSSAPTHRGSKRQRAKARRRLAHRLARGRKLCVKAWGRRPGQVTGLRAIVRGRTKIELDFIAPGTNANNPPAATTYLIKQSTHPIRDQHDFTAAQALCEGACRFSVTSTATKIKLTITALRPRTTYYYAVAARDNVTGQPGPRSQTAKGTTR